MIHKSDLTELGEDRKESHTSSCCTEMFRETLLRVEGDATSISKVPNKCVG